MLFFAKTVNDLFILLRAEGGRDESLRFTAGEERGAVGAREHALADSDGIPRVPPYSGYS